MVSYHPWYSLIGTCTRINTTSVELALGSSRSMLSSHDSRGLLRPSRLFFSPPESRCVCLWSSVSKNNRCTLAAWVPNYDAMRYCHHLHDAPVPSSIVTMPSFNVVALAMALIERSGASRETWILFSFYIYIYCIAAVSKIREIC